MYMMCVGGLLVDFKQKYLFERYIEEIFDFSCYSLVLRRDSQESWSVPSLEST